MKLLFLTDKYYPRPFANAICVQHVAHSFLKAGHSVDVIAYDDPFEKLPGKLDGVGVHGVPVDERLRLFYLATDRPSCGRTKLVMGAFRALNFASKLTNWSRYPLASKTLSRRISELAMRMHRKNGYDCIVATYGPIECIEAAVLIRAQFSDLPLFAYCVDYIPNTLRRHISEAKQRTATEYWVNAIGQTFDFVVGMAFEGEWYRCSYASAPRAQVCISDLPLLPDDISYRGVCNSVSIETGDWVYAGSLSKGHYNPLPAMQTYVNLWERDIIKKGCFHIVGRGDHARLCRDWEQKTRGLVRFHDYMAHDELEKMYERANVLVSMKCSDQISAKVFEYMAQSKPIVHFSEHPDDPDCHYIDRYPFGLTINALEGGANDWAACVSSWIGSLDGLAVPDNWVDVFQMNKPSYTRDLMLTRLSECTASSKESGDYAAL